MLDQYVVVVTAFVGILFNYTHEAIFFLYPHQSEDSTEGIPEGFFDDPKLDAKV